MKFGLVINCLLEFEFELGFLISGFWELELESDLFIIFLLEFKVENGLFICFLEFVFLFLICFELVFCLFDIFRVKKYENMK